MGVQISQRELQELKKKGYSDQEINEAISELEIEDLEDSYNQSKNINDPRSGAVHSSFGTKASDDIARWQLELNDILEKAEHTLKGDIVVFEKGQMIWKDNPEPEGNTFNSFGVQLLMKLLSMYVNRNTILADYTDEEVRYKTLDFGNRINNLIFMKYEEIGMVDEDKRKEYPAIVGAMTDIVHSAYSRAKDGRERESYRKIVSVQQSSTSGGGLTVNAGGQQKTRGLLNPMRYVAGKYA